MITLPEVLATFAQSDLASGALSPGWFQWGAVQGTHALFGLVAALGPMRWAVAGFALWTVKELAIDIPGAGLCGFAFAQWRLRGIKSKG